MANSQGPQATVSPQRLGPQHSDIGSEVEIVCGNHLFKKKNKSNRIGGGAGVVNSNCYHVSEREISECTSRPDPIHLQGLEEESLDSVFIGNISSQKS